MPDNFTYNFDTAVYKGAVTINTGLFIGGEWVDPIEESVTLLPEKSSRRLRVEERLMLIEPFKLRKRHAYKTTWGLKTTGRERGKALAKLAYLIEQNLDEFTALESLNVGKVYANAKHVDVTGTVTALRYYAGWADKIHGKTIETGENKLAYTRHEPYGVVGSIIPWNFPLNMLAWKIAPAMACGNTVVLKPSEITPLTALRLADLVNEAGFPPGTLNIVNGYGSSVGQAISEHMQIDKVAFTGSTLTGRRIMKAAGDSNLKAVTLELGGKSPTIIFDDADLEQAIKWTCMGLFFNMGQVCTAGSRIFVQEGVYDKFLEHFTAAAKGLAEKTGDPFASGTQHGPLVSQTQFDRVMSYIKSGKEEGATVHTGGERHGDKGFFVQPTIFTDAHPGMKIVQEEIFGPVEVIEQANDTIYGLASHIFSENTGRAIRVAHALESGMVWVNCANTVEVNVPFGGYKQSGNGRELGEYALETYTQVKAVHINIGQKL
ncbi:hypothetical protein D9611_013578 [Ephemerocybe angulata]|uniref:Aldehyde dehydrogenase domain-containing protein n=1 Tax=Ephemerocybe angulata TaxID=980116 RepID=A0A8H5ERI6_9AGAR|nr:hypothetical protein D9611_013578 [Tulosesus angulatus]